MAVTTRIDATGAWQAIAAAGEVAVASTQPGVWAITAEPTEPTFDGGMPINAYRGPTAMTLTGPEMLWVKAPYGAFYVTADTPL